MGHFSINNQSCLYTYYSQYSTRKLPQYLHVHTYMYTWIMCVYTYNREDTEHKLESCCSYIHTSCLYLQYVSLYIRMSASTPSASYSLVYVCIYIHIYIYIYMWRLLLLSLVKKQCSSFVWNSQGAVLYAHQSERLWFADCRHIFHLSKKKRHVKRKKQLAQTIKTRSTAYI